MFYYSCLALIFWTIAVNGVESASNSGSQNTASQLLERFLQSLIKDQSIYNQKQPNSYYYEETSSAAPTYYREQASVAPTPAPIPAQVESQPIWSSYQSQGSSNSEPEFPLLERFLSNNRNQQTNSDYSSAIQTPQQISPAQIPQQISPAQRPQQISSVYSPQQISPVQSSQHINGVQTGQQLYNPHITPTSSILPPPLSPYDNHYIPNGQSNGQPRYFNLDTERIIEGNNANIDKLNVSFIMPPQSKPLTLNFDSGDIVVDFGDKSTKLERISSSNYNSKIPELDQIFQYNTPTNTNKPIKEERDEDYIIVRHDMNKYTYDAPDSNGASNKPTEPLKVESYSVPTNKNRHFVLGRTRV